MRIGSLACLIAATTMMSPAAAGADDARRSLFQATGPGEMTVDLSALAEFPTSPGSSVLVSMSMPDETLGAVDLRLQRFAVTTEETRFVVGSLDGEDRDAGFDPNDIVLLRGDVDGHPGSHVYLAVSDILTTGQIDMGSGAGAFDVTCVRDDDGVHGDRIRVRRRAPDAGVSLPPGLALCGANTTIQRPPFGVSEGLSSTVGLGHLEMAIETDYEYYQLFDDLDLASAYAVVLWGAVSDIFQRDVNVFIELVFVRLWDTPDDLFNQPEPLSDFRQYWNQNMDDVIRDAAMFMSGRRDLPYGGIAWLNAVCTNFAYSVVGYVIGLFDDPVEPGIHGYDILVTAHELGHNAGAVHTHDLGLDICNDLDGPVQRGTIMSYCSQTHSGGNANIDLRFHGLLIDDMAEFLFDTANCVTMDCNQNLIPDFQDILLGTSDDLNGNQVPDECEDCNGNGILDPQDIADATSTDINTNGIPDECEPDCNENGIPDRRDIMFGGASDENANFIPDSCEADCNGNGTLDYSEIQADMSLDINRNIILDSCEDCDDDGTVDLDALAGAHHVWMTGHEKDGAIRELHATTGVLMSVSDPAQVTDGNDLVIEQSTGRVLVSSGGDHRIVEFDGSGAYVGDLVAAGSGGLNTPTVILLRDDGTMLVGSQGDSSVKHYDSTTGASLGDFVTPGDGGLLQPFGLAIGPDGHLYVNTGDHRVLRYDGSSGAFIDEFVSVADNGGLDEGRAMLFTPAGNLLVASHHTDSILEYDGATGAFLGKWNKGGTDSALTFDGPWGLRFGREGNVYAVRHDVSDDHPHEAPDHLHIHSTRIYIFDVDSGNFVRSYVIGHETGLWGPTGFDFYPGDATDCNWNQVPDACDIADGTSQDVNGNGVPDECEDVCLGDIADDDGVVGINDLLAMLSAWGPGGGAADIAPEGGDGTVDILDVLALLAAWGPCP